MTQSVRPARGPFTTWKTFADISAMMAEISAIDPSFDFPPVGGIGEFLAEASRRAFTFRHIPLEVWQSGFAIEYLGGRIEVHRLDGWYVKLEVAGATVDQVASAIIRGWDMDPTIAARAIPRACELLLAYI